VKSAEQFRHRFFDAELAELAELASSLDAEMRSNGLAAGVAQPQTTTEPSGGPFIRHSLPGTRTQYTAQPAFSAGTQVTQPLVSANGYVRKFRLQFAATGGSATNSAAVATDGLSTLISNLYLKDGYGTPLFNGTGYEMLFLVPKYGGGYGLWNYNDFRNMPSYSAVATGTGNFTFAASIPMEFQKGVGTLSMANASVLPTLQMTLAAPATVYGTVPNVTVPSLSLTLDADFYWQPIDEQIEPPELGTTQQWISQVCTPTIGSGSSMKVQFPRLGGYISTFILELRDSTNARVDQWPARPRLYIDGTPVIDKLLNEIYDDMANLYQFNTSFGRDTGIIAFSFKDDLSQTSLGLLDTAETYLSTSTATLIELGDGPWGTGGTPPYTLTVLAGTVVPAGPFNQGISQA
jgi:hypothetical protein